MRILITGGFGYVGGRLAEHLQKTGHQVVLGSRTSSNPPNWLPEADVINTTWSDDRSLIRMCDGVDVVVHAAGMNAQNCIEDPVSALEFNGVATARLLKVASRAGVRKFIYLSTAHVYASPLAGSITESNCPGNLHPYATSHLAGENVVLWANQRGGTEGVVLRLSNAFGAPMDKEVNCWMLLVNDLCLQAVRNRSMVLRSSGIQRRDFVALQDVCRAISHVIDVNRKQLGSDILNIGGGWAPRVVDMAALIQQRCAAVLGFTPEMVCPDAGSDEVTLDLDFCINRLLASGFELSGNALAEIDSTLAFCSKEFGNDQ
jgi:UDP-glucose 4-epimerase